MKNVGIRGVAVSMPKTVRDNEYFRTNFPNACQQAEERTLARVFTTAGRPAETLFDRAMEPFLRDPFRGAVERRTCAGQESSLDLEYAAALQVLQATRTDPTSIDLLISVGFLPVHLGIGNAVHLAGRLELRGAAWNLESACGGPLNAIQVACALVRSGEYRNVLITVACNYTTFAPPDDTMCWFLGDGGGALLIGETPHPSFLACHSLHSASTCGTWYYELAVQDGKPRIVMGASEQTGPVMRTSAEPYLRECCSAALDKAGMTIADIDAFVCHTPVAWFAEFAASALGIDPSKTVSTYPYYANVGPALTPANLHYAAATGRVSPGSRVLIYGPGSASSSVAMVVRWGEVGLGPLPPGVS